MFLIQYAYKSSLHDKEYMIFQTIGTMLFEKTHTKLFKYLLITSQSMMIN